MSIRFLAAAAVLATASAAEALPLSVEQILYQYNAVTSGDLASSQEVEGRVYVGGDLTGNTIQVGFVPLPSGSDANLVVAGETTIGKIWAGESGKAYLNDSTGVSTTMQAANSSSFEVLINGDFSGSDNDHIVSSNQGDLSGAVPEIDFDAVLAYSAFLAGLSGTQLDTSNPNAIRLDALGNAIQAEGGDWDASKVTIYNVDLANLSTGAFATSLLSGSDQTIIVNVSGTSGTFGVNALSDVTLGANILWNFYEATDIFVDRKIVGSILAPSATLSAFSGSTEGSVLAKSINLTYGELHLQAFTGDLPDYPVSSAPTPPAVPLPASLPLLLGGLGIVGGARLLRRR